MRKALSVTPLRFVPAGEESPFDFACLGLDYGLFLDGSNARLVLHGTPESGGETAIVCFELQGALPTVVPVALEPLGGVSNFYRGADPSRWREDVPSYGRVACPEVYSGIDLVYYGREGELEYDFVVAPGADPCAIAFELAGARSLRIDARGDLVVETSAGDLVQRAPIAYQEVGSRRVAVEAGYELRGTKVGIHVGAYDARLPLVVDPVVVFSTFLGGSGGDQAWDFDVDALGNVCVAGYTASINFPVTASGGLNGFWDMFVAKFNPSGTALIYSTLLSASGSGTSVTEYATGVACDTFGNAYVTGRTNAMDFPILNARQPSNAGNTDAVLVKLNSAGQIVFSTYHGGSGNENGRFDSVSRCGKIAVDSDRNIYVTGSSNSTNFPLANALDATVSGTSCAGGCADMFLSKFSPDGQTLVFSTFIGDALPEEPVGIVVDAQRDIYVGGNNGTILLHKIASSGQNLLYTRSIVNGPDGGHSTLLAFDVDPLGRVAITGLTSSGAYPTTPGTWSPSYTGCFSGTCEEAFVTVLAPDNGPILASTYVGVPTYNEAGTAIRFDRNGDIVFALRTRRDSGPWFGELWKFDPGLSQRLAQVSLCGAGEATDLHVDAANNVRVIGWVWNGSSPVSTPGAYQPAHGGNIDVFLTAFDMQSPPPATPTQPFCFGDGSGAACPCANNGTTGRGCGNASFATGARLVSSGIAGASAITDSFVLTATELTGPGLFFQGTIGAGSGARASFGDGLLCVGGNLARLGVVFPTGGTASYPGGLTPSPIHVAGSTASGDVRHYQCWYRDAIAFCTADTFNLTQALTVSWGP